MTSQNSIPASLFLSHPVLALATSLLFLFFLLPPVASLPPRPQTTSRAGSSVLYVGPQGSNQGLASPRLLGLDNGTPRLLGLDTGNPAADGEAEMWIMALIGVLAAAIPVAFLNPSLGFRKRRSVEEDEEIFEKLRFAQKGVEEGEEVFNS